MKEKLNAIAITDYSRGASFIGRVTKLIVLVRYERYQPCCICCMIKNHIRFLLEQATLVPRELN